MPTIVELPDKTELEFPDGMSESDMRNVISSRFPQFSKQEPGRTPLSQTPYPAKMEDVGVSGGEFENVQPVVLPPFGKPGTVTRGISKGLTGVVEFGTSPAGVALAPAMMIPGVGPVLAAGMTGGAVWQGALKASEAIEKKSPEAAGEALVMGGLGALGALGTVASIPESARLLPETTREVIKVPEAVAKLETPVTAKPAEPQPVVEPKPSPTEPVVVGYETAEGVVPGKAVVKGEAIPPALTPNEQAEARADLAAELGEEPQAPVTPEPAPAPETPAVSAPEAKAPEPTPPAKVEAPEPRKIVAIASRLGDQVEIGNIHLDAENKLRKKLGITENDPRVEDIEHGFIDNQGNFLGREEAWTVAQAAKQVKARTEDPGFLGKEDLKKGTLPKEPKPPETPPTGPGMAVQPTTPEARLSQSLQSVPKQKPPPQGPAPQPMGITPFPGLVTGLQKVAQSAQRVWREIADVPKFKPFKRVINKFHGDTNRTSLKIRQMQADIESRVPDPKRLEAITNWLQADGDVPKLQQWEAATRNPKLRQGYRDAQHLTPYEVQVAKSIRQYYDDLLARGQAYGILDQAKDDYVTQIWKRPLLGGAQFAQFASKLSRTFKFGMKSVFENFFEGEQAGFKPMTKNISKLLGVYVSELEKTIATRDMIRNLTHETASDGNPLAKVEGTAHISEDQAGDPTGPMFVRPGVVNGDVRYAELNHPALKNWKWVSKDPESGRDVFILGELRVHPEIRRHLSNALSQSQISKWMREPSESELANILKLAARFGDTASRVIKQTMLGTLSMFHHVQEGTHAVGHRANAFLPEKLGFDATNPKNALFNYALDHGLQVAGDRIALENFREGLGSYGVFEKVPVLGKLIEKHNDLLFNEYIPRLKWDTWQRIYARNLDRYKREIAKGEITQDDVAYLSSKQTNAAFGHQNYVDLGRNATIQHVLRLFGLAPDFLEARTRFAGQALQGVVSKVGREQLEALGVLGGLFFVGARVLNKLSDDDWHWEEPFKVKYGNRWYGMRSVPEDVWRAFKDTRMFAYNRLNPVFGRPLMELMSGVNYRGEKIPASEVFKNALVSGIPIQMREAPAFRNLTETQRNTTITAWEQFLSAMGIQVSRYSPLNQTYKLATKWRNAQGEKEAPTTYPVSKYQPMRYALEDRDLTKATDELIKLTEGGKVPLIKIAQGFRTSLHSPLVAGEFRALTVLHDDTCDFMYGRGDCSCTPTFTYEKAPIGAKSKITIECVQAPPAKNN